MFEVQNVESNFLPQQIVQISDVDKKILKELVLDSRQTIVELHKKLGTSIPTIAKSIKELKSNNVILANRVLIDFSKIDLHRYTILMFASPTIEKKLIQYCKQNRKIWDIGKYCGTYNYVVELFARDNVEFDSIINSLKNSFKDDIFRMDVLLVSSELKREYFYL